MIMRLRPQHRLAAYARSVRQLMYLSLQQLDTRIKRIFLAFCALSIIIAIVTTGCGIKRKQRFIDTYPDAMRDTIIPAQFWGPDSARVYSVFELDEMPERIVGTNPRMPQHLRERGCTEPIMYGFVINSEGIVEPESVRIKRTNEISFLEIILDGTLNSRYRPGRRQGVPVYVWMETVATFSVGSCSE